jgi:pimeloyl-ACP methyl ester carboxylesterase
MVNVPQQTIETDHGTVTYRDVGSGFPILYFHGTGAHSDAALLLDSPLLASRCRLIVPNRPGYVGSAIGPRGSAQFCAAQAKRLLDHLDIDRVVVVGTSGGGMPAAAFSVAFPDLTAGLILQCCQSHQWDNRVWMPKGLGWSLPLFKHRFFAPFLKWETLRQAKAAFKNPRRCLRKMSGDRYHEIAANKDAFTQISELTAMSLKCAQRPSGIENDWAILLADNGIKENSIHCPTLIIHDRTDPLVPFAHAEWSHKMIADSILLDVHTGGHLIWFGRDYSRLHEVRVDFVRQALAA